MNGKKMSVFVKAASVFLILSVIFCIYELFANKSQKNQMEQLRLENETALAELQISTPLPVKANYESESKKTVIVLDAGHGKPSSQMSNEEKSAEGYEYNEDKECWGEWRHYKNHTFGEDCRGEDCTQLSPKGASCWYPMNEADRDAESEINLNNALAAKEYLEQMGYEVRMTRSSEEENPSMNKRVSYCFPNNDIALVPDAAAYICIHSNAGGGSGSSYISLGGTYTQKFIEDEYILNSNEMGRTINDKVADIGGFSNNQPINSPYLILFNKCPVPIAYLEIGFLDNVNDLEILQNSSDIIGRAIAEGADEYLRNNLQ